MLWLYISVKQFLTIHMKVHHGEKLTVSSITGNDYVIIEIIAEIKLYHM